MPEDPTREHVRGSSPLSDDEAPAGCPAAPAGREPVDPDVGPRERLTGWSRTAGHARTFGVVVRDRWDVLLAIACGGAAGASARWACARALPHDAGTFPLSTVIVNVVGSLLLGAVMAVAVEAGRGHRLLRPFAGVGVLGGFTTFSTAMADVHSLLLAGRTPTAAAYLLVSVVGGVVAVTAGQLAARVVLRRLGVGVDA